MTWFKVDDGLHKHRKRRKVTRSHPSKIKDIAPMGLWVIAGSWCGDAPTGGFVPAEVLEEWDDDWMALAQRLVDAGFWWETTQDGEPGYGFHDWQDYVPTPDGIADASSSGGLGNHNRWHRDRGVVNPDCEHCIGSDRGDIGAIDRGDGGRYRVRDREPVPSRPDPTRPDRDLSSDPSSEIEPAAPDRFEEFWRTYDHKVTRKKAETAFANAVAKPGVTADRVIAAAAAYVGAQKAMGKHPQYTKHPTTWLHGECWNDEPPKPPPSRSEQWLELGQRLHREEIK